MKLYEITRKERWLQSQGRGTPTDEEKFQVGRRLYHELKNAVYRDFEYWDHDGSDESMGDWAEAFYNSTNVDEEFKALEREIGVEDAQTELDNIVDDIRDDEARP